MARSRSRCRRINSGTCSRTGAAGNTKEFANSASGKSPITANRRACCSPPGHPKIRVTQTVKDVPAGRYKLTAWIRGLDIGEGVWQNNTEFEFDGKYTSLKKNGTFGWTPLTYVAEIKQKKNVDLSFGLWASGYFWIDDVSLVRVGNDVRAHRRADTWQRGKADRAAGTARCRRRSLPRLRLSSNMATGEPVMPAALRLRRKSPRTVRRPQSLTSFEGKIHSAAERSSPTMPATARKPCASTKVMPLGTARQDWSGYDYLKADLYSASKNPISLHVEMRDSAAPTTIGRAVNYETMLPPGKSTLVLPLAQLYVGEKARPGRKLLLNAITQFVLGIDEQAAAPIYHRQSSAWIATPKRPRRCSKDCRHFPSARPTDR